MVKPLELMARQLSPGTLENAKVLAYLLLPGGLILGNIAPRGSDLSFEDRAFYLINGTAMEAGIKAPVYLQILKSLVYT